jgi:hypothetical protein
MDKNGEFCRDTAPVGADEDRTKFGEVRGIFVEGKEVASVKVLMVFRGYLAAEDKEENVFDIVDVGMAMEGVGGVLV